MKNKLLELLGFDKLVDTVQKLIEVRVSLIKDEISEKIAESMSNIIPLILVMLSFAAFLMFASLTLAFYLSQLFESIVYGFGAVSLIYLILVIILYSLKDSKGMTDYFKKEIKKRT